jgi:hypothetical protein
MPIVQFWLNAFIPRDVTGYTKLLTAGVHKGKTAVPLPGIARTWPGNTFKDWDAGYLTDQRTFDPSPTASARMKSMVEVEMVGPVVKKQSHTSSGTTEVNIKTGVQTGFAVADMSRCGFLQAPTPAAPSGGMSAHFAVARGPTVSPAMYRAPPPGMFGSITLVLTAAAGDPLVGMAADIDYGGELRISGGSTPNSVIVSFQGKIDDFPAYDCYASFNGVTKEVFRSAPPPGNTVANLLGPAKRPVSGTVRFP